MRSVLLVVCLTACGSTAGSAERTPQLGPLPIADPAQPGGAYLTSVALQLQPGWSQFLEDCRLRLPADHPLNRVKLAAIAELVIGRDGHVIESSIAASSGNPDFDKAVKDAVREAKLPAPPIDALSDDDRVYLRWMFARDRRQAGPATAELVHKELPLAQAIARFIAAHDLGRAARRIHDGNAEAVTAVMTATLRDAIENGVDTAVQRAAVNTIGDAKLAPFVKPIAGLLDATDDQLRAAATITIGELGDRAMVKPLAERLARHLAAHDRLAIADAQALVALGADPAPVIEGALPDPIALEASAKAPRWTPKLVAAMKGNALTRTAACIALAPHLDHAEVLAAITRGLADPDASVRASCAAAAPPRLVEQLLHDRDRAVRASAVLAIGTADPSKIAGAL
ncbi:MAG TPA: TonB family protein, partial [Kofleriaceae bacterium]